MPHSTSSYQPPQYGGYQPPGKGPDPYGPVDKEGVANLLTPKTVVQLAVWILMFGLGAGLSGLILFAVYQGQVNSLRSELLESQEELQKSLEEKIGSAPAPTESPNQTVSGTSPSPVDPTKQLVQTTAPAIVGITGKDSSGAPASGTGFVVNSTDDGTWVVTSYKLVAGVKEFNDLSVRHRNSDLVGEVYETDPGRDLALVIYRVAAERSLRFSRVTEPKEGDQVYALGSMRGQPYATGIAAKLTSVTSGSLGIDTEIPDSYLGGPLLDADGRVVGILTKSAGGSTATPAAGTTRAGATPIEAACSRVLRCPSNNRTKATPSPSPGQTASPAPAPPAAPPTEAPPQVGPGDVVQPPVSNPNTADVPIG